MEGKWEEGGRERKEEGKRSISGERKVDGGSGQKEEWMWKRKDQPFCHCQCQTRIYNAQAQKPVSEKLSLELHFLLYK